jgi:hypothetical protein
VAAAARRNREDLLVAIDHDVIVSSHFTPVAACSCCQRMMRGDIPASAQALGLAAIGSKRLQN